MITRKLVTGPIAAIIILSLTFAQPSYASTSLLTQASFSSTAKYIALSAVGAGLVGAALSFALSSHSNDNNDITKIEPEVITLIEATDIFFTEPGDSGIQELILTNSCAQEANINEPIFTGGAADGRVIVVENNCRSIPANGECRIKLKATQEAYDGKVSVAYIYDYYNERNAEANILVAKTNLELRDNGDNPITSILAEKIENPPPGPNPQTFKLVNIGKFPWLSPQIVWKTNTKPINVELDATNCTNQTKIDPNGSCTFTLTTSQDLQGDWGKLDLQGLNFYPSPFYVDVLCKGLISIIENTDAADLHLGYRSIKVASTVTEGTAKLTTVGIPIAKVNETNKIKYCASGDTDCAFQTNCATDTVLEKHGNPGDSCLIWFKSINAGESALYTDTTGTITVNPITAQGSIAPPGESLPEDTETERFTTSTDQAVYAGGDFTTQGSHIAKLKGTTWSGLNGGITGTTVNALTVFKGDIYAGGGFIATGGIAANNVAKWNGANWLPLSTGTNNNVLAFDFINDTLYLGGSFTSPSSRIAQWNGTNFSGLSTGANNNIYTIVALNNVLYAGGDFTQIGGISTRFGRWDGSWHSFDGTMGSYTSVNASASADDKFYVGGNFGGGLGEFYINFAQGCPEYPGYDLCIAYGAGAGGPDGTVYTINYTNGYIYAGGNFTDIAFGASGMNNITKKKKVADGQSGPWEKLGSGGTNNTIYALTHTANDLYVGGDFSTVNGGDITTSRIAKWDSVASSWSAAGDGSTVNGTIRSLIGATSLDLEWSCTPGDPPKPEGYGCDPAS
ncbi:MAG: hypothetical protein KKE11_02320 [Gammaproteobacteria bacterium]|nr:hypothetical protein [Gammaproteobacteria bacterium]